MRLTPRVLLILDENKNSLSPPKLINLALFQRGINQDRYKISRVIESDRYDIDICSYVIKDLNILLTN